MKYWIFLTILLCTGHLAQSQMEIFSSLFSMALNTFKMFLGPFAPFVDQFIKMLSMDSWKNSLDRMIGKISTAESMTKQQQGYMDRLVALTKNPDAKKEEYSVVYEEIKKASGRN